MPQSPSTQAAQRFVIPRSLMAGFVVAALATMVIAFVNYRASEVRGDAVAAIERASQGMRQLSLVHSALKDMETGQRGYLLTGNLSYLQPYQLAHGVYERQLTALKESTDSQPAQRRLVTQIEDLARQKIRELEETVELRKAGNTEAAMELVRTDAGKNTMTACGTWPRTWRACRRRISTNAAATGKTRRHCPPTIPGAARWCCWR